MTAVTLQGGLGNQLFQFAAAKTVQPDPTRPVVVDTRYGFAWPGQLGSVLHPESFIDATTRDILRLRQIPRLPRLHRTVFEWQHRRATGLGTSRLVLESAPAVPRTGEVLLRGYFQELRWVDPRAANIAASFLPVSPAVLSMIAEYSGTTVGVSVRAGRDYQEFGVCLPMEYYLDAAELLDLPECTFIVAGDDHAACELVAQGLTKRFGGTVILASRFGPKTQMDLVSLCQFQIIANSSFAWWSAWIGDRRAVIPRRVVRPEPWLPESRTDCPEAWLALDARHTSSWP